MLAYRKPTIVMAPNDGTPGGKPSDVGRPRLVARMVEPRVSKLSPRGVPSPIHAPLEFFGGPQEKSDEEPQAEEQFHAEPATYADTPADSVESLKAFEAWESEELSADSSDSFDLAPEVAPDVVATDINEVRTRPILRPELKPENEIEQASHAPTVPSTPHGTEQDPELIPRLKRIKYDTAADAVTKSGIQNSRRALSVSSLSIATRDGSLIEDAEFTASKGELLGLAGLGARAVQAMFEVILGVRKATNGFVEFGASTTPVTDQMTSEPCGWLRLHHAALIEQPWPLLGDGPNSREILTNAARILGLQEPAATAARFEDLVGLSGVKPQTLGWELPYRIRLATALTLMPNPSLLLVDFPTRDLGPENARWVWSILEQYQDDTGATVLVASNDLEELERLCDRVVLFADRFVIGDSSPTDLAQRMGREDLKRDFLEPANLDR